MLLSKYALDFKPFNEHKSEAVSWEKSSIRQWLNGDFYYSAFNSEEKKGIYTQSLDNKDYKFKYSPETMDKVFLLSIIEAVRYFTDDKARRAYTTPYAADRKFGSAKSSESPVFWWLRTPGFKWGFGIGQNVVTIQSNGSLDVQDIGGKKIIGVAPTFEMATVRPAIRFSLAALPDQEYLMAQFDDGKGKEEALQQAASAGGNSDAAAKAGPARIRDGLARVKVPFAQKKNPNAIAVIIGVKNYENNVPAVEYALNDAASVKNFVIKTLGYSADNVIYVEDPTKGKMEEIFGNEKDYKAMLYDFVKPGQSDVFIYYAGHGAPDQENRTAYFVPKEANPDYIKHSGYAMATLYGNLAKLPARKITVVTDACFSGQTGTGKMIIKGASPLAVSAKIPVAAAGRGNGKMNVFNASRDTEMASWYTQKGHGMFTFYFLLGLSGAADKDGDKTITAGEMDEYLQQTVPYRTRRMYHRSQTPMFIGNKDDVIAAYR